VSVRRTVSFLGRLEDVHSRGMALPCPETESDMVTLTLTVYFEDPFWVGVYTRTSSEGRSYARIVYGAEPSDLEVFEGIHRDYPALRFTETDGIPSKCVLRANPKRHQRLAAREMNRRGGETKAQAAFKKQTEEGKVARKTERMCRRRAKRDRRVPLKTAEEKGKT